MLSFKCNIFQFEPVVFTEIPEGTKKCCSGCFTKINRKIGQALSEGGAAALRKDLEAKEGKNDSSSKNSKEAAVNAVNNSSSSNANSAVKKENSESSKDQVTKDSKVSNLKTFAQSFRYSIILHFRYFIQLVFLYIEVVG